MPKTKGATNGPEEEEHQYLREENSCSEWCLPVFGFVFVVLLQPIHGSLLRFYSPPPQCFKLIFRKYILVYRPRRGTRTVTLAFSFLGDVI